LSNKLADDRQRRGERLFADHARGIVWAHGQQQFEVLAVAERVL
jgi:hypothetical protein